MLLTIITPFLSLTGTCTLVDHPGNATVVSGSSSYKLGNVVRYSCKAGYHLAHGNLVRACKLPGKLSGSPPKCLGKHIYYQPV